MDDDDDKRAGKDGVGLRQVRYEFLAGTLQAYHAAQHQ